MKLDALFDFDIGLGEAPDLAARAEASGFSGIWMCEVRRDPFLTLAVSVPSTSRVTLGTSVAVAFARSPTVVAHTAWDLAAASGGRFVLGLGTQVRAHVERRFAMSWSGKPATQLRDYIAAIRAVWLAWRSGENPDRRGSHYPVSLMTPFFTPQPMAYPEIPIHIAAVGPGMCQLAGEVADGLIVHPLHSRQYLDQIIRPAVDTGLERGGRAAGAIEITALVFVAVSEEERDGVRRDIAFYASTPSYRALLGMHGWEGVSDQLGNLARQRRWSDMPALVSDEMVDAFAITAPWPEIAAHLHRRYAGTVDRVALYRPYGSSTDADGWHALLGRFPAAASG